MQSCFAPRLVVDHSDVELELRHQAQQLTEQDWLNPIYLVLEQAAVAWLEGELTKSRLRRVRLESHLAEMWEEYRSTPILPREVTAETALLHRLMEDGLNYWAESLAACELAERDQFGWDEALALAEDGCRLLAVVARLRKTGKRG